MKRIFRLLAFVALLSGAAVQGANADEDRVKLTPDEVKTFFIDKPWFSVRGAFLFRSDGNYSYQGFAYGKRRGRGDTRQGTWPYVMEDDGTLTGGGTSYTFYKVGDGYQYHHSLTGRYSEALPNKSFEFE